MNFEHEGYDPEVDRLSEAERQRRDREILALVSPARTATPRQSPFSPEQAPGHFGNPGVCPDCDPEALRARIRRVLDREVGSCIGTDDAGYAARVVADATDAVLKEIHGLP